MRKFLLLLTLCAAIVMPAASVDAASADSPTVATAAKAANAQSPKAAGGALPTASSVAANAQGKKKSEDGSGALLTVEPGMAIWTLVIFVILLAILSKWVWPSILGALNDREAKIRDDFQEAERARNDAQKTLDEYKAQLAEARREAQQIVEKSRDDARRLAEQLKEQTQQDLAQMRRRMEVDIDAAKQQAISEMYEQTATIATRVASKILNREITLDDQRGLVDESLREFQALEHNN